MALPRGPLGDKALLLFWAKAVVEPPVWRAMAAATPGGQQTAHPWR